MRRSILSLAAALYGFACGIALLPAWLRPAPPGQLPGLMTSLGLDARASYRFYLGIVICTLLAPLLARPLYARMETARKWAFVAMTSALAFSLWIAAAQENVFWVALPPLVVAIACLLLCDVRRRFTRGDVA